MKFSIRYKVLVGYLVILIVSIAMQYWAFIIAQQYITQQTALRFDEKTHIAADQILNFMARVERDHLGVAQTYTASQPDKPDKINDIIRFTLRQNPFFEKISILSTSGRELYKVDRFGTLDPKKISYEIPTESMKAAVGGTTGISKVYFPENVKKPYVDVFTPIISTKGTIDGVVKSQIRLEQLWDVVAQIKLGNGGFAYVVDDEGRLLAHPDSALVLKGTNYAARVPIAKVLQNHTHVTPDKLDEYDNERGTTVAASALEITGLKWIVVVEQPQKEAFSQANVILNIFILALLITTTLLVAISIFISNSITRPIIQLKQLTKRITRGEFGKTITIHSGDEVESLGHSLNTMSQQLNHYVLQLNEKISLLQLQKKQLDTSSQQLIKQDQQIGHINQQLESEKDHMASERNKLSIILSGVKDAVIAVDLNRTIVLFNAAAERLTHYKTAEVIGRPLGDIIKLYDQDVEIPVADYCPIRTDDFEGFMVNKESIKIMGNNHESYVNLVAGKIRDGASSNLGCILSLHDVTQEKQLEQMKLDFVSMAAHELRTPMTAIRGYSEVLYHELATSTEEHVNEEHMVFLKRLVASCKNLGNLIDNLLNVSRIERGMFKVETKSTSLSEIIGSVLLTFEEIASVRKQTIRYIKPEQELPMVNADSFRIGQVLSNLLANAINYTPQGGQIEIKVSRKLFPDLPNSDQMVITVTDNGIGIPPDAMPHLFTKFYRVDGERKERVKGTGLGLYISKSIITAHGGRIWVESKDGHGSQFNFSIPVAQS